MNILRFKESSPGNPFWMRNLADHEWLLVYGHDPETLPARSHFCERRKSSQSGALHYSDSFEDHGGHCRSLISYRNGVEAGPEFLIMKASNIDSDATHTPVLQKSLSASVVTQNYETPLSLPSRVRTGLAECSIDLRRSLPKFQKNRQLVKKEKLPCFKSSTSRKVKYHSSSKKMSPNGAHHRDQEVKRKITYQKHKIHTETFQDPTRREIAIQSRITDTDLLADLFGDCKIEDFALFDPSVEKMIKKNKNKKIKKKYYILSQRG